MRHQFTFQLIDAIAKAGSIRRAAENMAITPSALNRRLLALEEELDVALFERMATGVRLSAAGELVIAHARRQIADMERIRSIIEDMKGSRWGNVEIAIDKELIPNYISEAIARYRTEHNRVNFMVHRSFDEDMANKLLNYDVNLACIVNPKPHPALWSLATAPLVIKAVLSPAHPMSNKREIRLNDLIYFPLALPQSGSLKHILDTAASKQGYQLRSMVESDLNIAQHEIATTETIGFELCIANSNSQTIPNLKSIPISGRDIPEQTLHLMQLQGRSLSVAASRFSELLSLDFAKYSDDV